MALVGVNKYVDTSASSDGDGSFSSPYNSIQSALSAAPANPSSELARWLIWARRLNSGSSISVSSTLSPANDGSKDAPHLLIGFPFRRQETGMSVDSVPSGTDNLGYNKAQWQFVDSALTEGDRYWVDAEVEFTSGSNNGLKRRVIHFDSSSDTIYLDFPLPNNIASGDTYTITLETEYYDDRPSEASTWDSDTNVRPILDTGGTNLTMLDCSSDAFWNVYNLFMKNGSNGRYICVQKAHKIGNILTENGILNNIVESIDRCYVEATASYGGYHGMNAPYMTSSHVTKGSGTALSRDNSLQPVTMKNCTFGRISQIYKLGGAFKAHIRAENVLIDAYSFSIEWYGLNYTNYTPKNMGMFFGGYQGEPDKFHDYLYPGEIYNLDENATIDPPSGATTFIKIAPNSNCNSYWPLIHEERRYQSSGSKTYAWKFYPSNMSLGATDLEVEAWYLDESSGTHRTYATANPSAYSDGGWHDLSITINPAQAGVVYFKIKLKKYNTSGCYVALDPKVDVS